MNFCKKLFLLGRYNKPAGFFYLYWPCMWGTATMAQSIYQISYWAPIFLAGSITMRAAGCIVNDIIDKDIDNKVQRTKNRMLSSGQLTVKQALYFLIPNLTVGLLVLYKMTVYSIILSFSIVPIAALYPFAKRYISIPQLVLGIAYNWGAWIGASVVATNSIFPVIFIYSSGIIWTLLYDTVYAIQDFQDDSKLNIKSSALYFQNNYPLLFKFLTLFSGFGWICLAIKMEWDLAIWLPGNIGIHYWLYRQTQVKNNQAGKAFRKIHWFGAMMLIWIIFNKRMNCPFFFE